MPRVIVSAKILILISNMIYNKSLTLLSIKLQKNLHPKPPSDRQKLYFSHLWSLSQSHNQRDKTMSSMLH